MAHNYYVTAHKPTGVHVSVSGNFTSSSDINLIMAKTTRLEIHLITPDGLRPLLDVGVYGRIAVVKLFRPQGEKQDLMLVVTERYRVMVLGYDSQKSEIVTRAFGDVQDRVGRPSETGIIAAIDPECKLIALRLYDGQLKIIQLELDSGHDLRAYTIRLLELHAVDLDFLHCCPAPTLALIYQNVNGRHLKAYELMVKDKDLGKDVWSSRAVELEATMLITVPGPLGGALVIGQESVTYYTEKGHIPIAPPEFVSSPVVSYGKVDADGSRYLLGDMQGRLYMLLLDKEEQMDGTAQVRELKVSVLGEAVVSRCLTYLDNGVVFVGSTYGDSNLVKLMTDRDENGSFIQVLEAFTNLGPVIDMVVVDLDRQGQGQLVTCSGAYKEGSLRIIRNGIGIQEHASLDLEGIKGIWPLQVSPSSENSYDNTLVLTFVGQTRILTLSGEEVEETEISGFVDNEQTLYAGNVTEHQLLQVTHARVRLIERQSLQLVSEWQSPSGRNISVVACNPTQVVAAVGCDIYCLEILAGNLVQSSHTTVEHEVACLDINPSSANMDHSDLVAIGLWTDITVRVHRLPSLEPIVTQALGGEIIPRSVLLATFEQTLYLLCALGDGSFFYFVLDAMKGTLSGRKKVVLGTQPTVLKPFYARGTFNVFTCSDRPAVIYSSSGKLVFSNVNLKEMSHMCPINTEAYPDSLAIANNTTLTFGTIDEIQKLHITTIPLGESPKRIAYQETSQSFGVCSTRYEYKDPAGMDRHQQQLSVSLTAPNISVSPDIAGVGGEGDASSVAKKARDGSKKAGDGSGPSKVPQGELVETDSFLVFDQHTLEITHAHHLRTREWAMSLTSCCLSNGTVYYCVGTAFVNPEEPEPKTGRILLFEVNDGKLMEVVSKDVKGGVYSLVDFNGKILAGINNAVCVFDLKDDMELQMECSYYNTILALYLKCKGDFVLVGDLMRSLTVLLYKPDQHGLEEIARDYNNRWMSAVEILDDDSFLGAENSYNLFTCQKDSAATTDDDRQHLQDSGYLHIGEFVNVFRHGSLVMENLGELAAPVQNPVLFGCVSGSIGMVAMLPHSLFQLLADIQKRLTKVVRSLGNIEHSFWRSFSNETSTYPSQGFIDGDLIEMFLDLPRSAMQQVTSGLQIEDGGMKRDATVEDIVKVVEDLTRIH